MFSVTGVAWQIVSNSFALVDHSPVDTGICGGTLTNEHRNVVSP